MKKVIQICLVLILSALASVAIAKTYEVGKVCDTQPSIILEQVENTEDETILTFSNNSSQEIRIWPPGHDKSYFITDVRKTNKYYLLDIQGVSIAPNWSKPKSFKLVFERIPDSLKRFHVVEGSLMASGTANFMNVKLK